VALHNNLVVRVGCFCNIGACQKYLVSFKKIEQIIRVNS
jgi:hypothetical protein